MADHDHSYKQLFSHPELIRDLLNGFVHEDWISGLHLDTLERVSSSYVTDDLREREDDIIWRVRLGDSWIYVYLLIEFQSTVDHYMAVRLLTYIGLLYQDLQRTGQLPEDGRLPPVLPLVLYNGRGAWSAPLAIGQLIQDVTGGLEKYRPEFQYLLIEEQKYRDAVMPEHNLVSAIFRLEQSQYPEDVRAVVKNLISWLKRPEQTSIRRAFTVWINRVLLPVRLKDQKFPETNDLQEVENMLAERVKEWTEEWKNEGIQQGIQKGMQQGIQKGIQQGMQKGMLEDAREMVLDAFHTKFGTVPADFRNRITATTDRNKLKEILRLVVTTNSMDDLEKVITWN